MSPAPPTQCCPCHICHCCYVCLHLTSHGCAVLRCMNTQQCAWSVADGHGGSVPLGATLFLWLCMPSSTSSGKRVCVQACASMCECVPAPAGSPCGRGPGSSRPCLRPLRPEGCTLLPVRTGVPLALHPLLDDVKSFKCSLF